MRPRFSERHNYKSQEVPITIREDFPVELRYFVIQSAYEYGLSPSPVRNALCRVLMKNPNPENWTDFPNIDYENRELIESCEWFYVYDTIENLYELICEIDNISCDSFGEKINEYFRRNGIGWQLTNGEIQYRGNEEFEEIKSSAVKILEEKGKGTSKHEIQEAIKDLSKKPHADITGAIQHSLAGLECIVREVVGDKGLTLGALMKKHPTVVPKPLDTAIEKLWGYSSNMGRHLREETPPEYDEAELLVSLSASLISYLAKKNFPDKDEMEDFF